MSVQKANNMRANRRSRSPPGKKEYLPAVKDLQFAPPAGSGGAVRTWGISYKGQPFSATLPGVLSPFDPSSPMEDATRLTLTLRLPSGWDSVFDCFEACLLHEMVEKSAEFFGRAVPEEHQVHQHRAAQPFGSVRAPLAADDANRGADCSAVAANAHAVL